MADLRIALCLPLVVLLGCPPPPPPPPPEKQGGDGDGGQATSTTGDGDGAQTSAPPNCAPPSGAWYLHLSDVHLGTADGQPCGADTSVPLWASTKTALRTAIKAKPKFLLYTGDLPDHSPDSGEHHKDNIVRVLDDLACLAGSPDATDPECKGDLPLLYLPGNNDTLDSDYGTFTAQNAPFAGKTPLAEANWAAPVRNVDTWAWGSSSRGYYSAAPVSGLRVIAMNTVMFTSSSRYPQPPDEPCEALKDSDTTPMSVQDCQLAWLGEELDAAKAAGQKALIAMHIPPGIDAYGTTHPSSGEPGTIEGDPGDCGQPVSTTSKSMWKQPAWGDAFLAQVASHSDTVVGVAYGHTHVEEFRRLYDSAHQRTALALSAPGISLRNGNNPAFKAVSYDPKSFALTDSLTWYGSTDECSASSKPASVTYTWAPGNCYRYSEVFKAQGCDAPGATLAGCLNGATNLSELNAALDTVYYAGLPGPSYSDLAIEVCPGQ